MKKEINSLFRNKRCLRNKMKRCHFCNWLICYQNDKNVNLFLANCSYRNATFFLEALGCRYETRGGKEGCRTTNRRLIMQSEMEEGGKGRLHILYWGNYIAALIRGFIFPYYDYLANNPVAHTILRIYSVCTRFPHWELLLTRTDCAGSAARAGPIMGPAGTNGPQRRFERGDPLQYARLWGL